MARLDELQLEQLLEQLKLLRAELGQEVDALQESKGKESTHRPEEQTISKSVQNDRSHSQPLEDCQDRIRQVEEALQKIDLEFYGYCKVCGSPITAKSDEELSDKEVCKNCLSNQVN